MTKFAPHQISHALHFLLDLDQGDAGVAHQILVDIQKPVLALVLLLGDEYIGQAHNGLGKGEQDKGGDHLENNMTDGYLHYRIRGDGGQPLRIGGQHGDRHEEERAEYIVDKIDDRRALGVVFRVDRGQEGGHRGADVDATD